MKPSLGFILVLLVLLVVFFLQNTEAVEVEFLFWERPTSLAIVITVSTLVGFIFGLVGPRLFHSREERYQIRDAEDPDKDKEKDKE